MKIIFLFTFLNLALFSQGIDSSRAKIINSQVLKFQNLLQTIETQFVDTVDLQKASEAAFRTLLSEVDNQSYYFTEEEYKNIVRQQKGESTYGIGIEIKTFQDTVYVTKVLKNSSADSNDIQIGDIILFADDEKVSGTASSKAANIINGKKDTKLSLIIKRNTEVGLIEVTANRGVYPVSSIESNFMIPNSNIGYLKISTFTQSTYDDIIKTINKLKDNGLERLIIDLRNNPGGLLEEAVRVAGLFLDSNSLITNLTAKNKAFEKEYRSNVKPIFRNIPLSIIINKETASAAEILAGSMQDYDRGLVLGEKSFGKGTVQNAWVFGDSSAFRMTISKYTTPSGRHVEKITKNEKVNIDTQFMSEEVKNSIEKSMALLGGSKNVKIFKSNAGRIILATGGIFPDKLIEEDTLTLLTRVYIERDYITEFALKYFATNKNKLKEKYKDNYIDFIQNFQISNEMINEFAVSLDKYKVFNKEMYEKDKIYILNYLKAKLAYFIWGQNAYSYALINIDKLVIESVRNMPQKSLIEE